MKRRILFLLTALMLAAKLFAVGEIFPPPPAREFRGVWLATVANIDWPSKPGLPVAQQKAELISLLDRAAQLKFNAVLFQVRPVSDAFYASPLEPYDAMVFSGSGLMGREVHNIHSSDFVIFVGGRTGTPLAGVFAVAAVSVSRTACRVRRSSV